MDYIRIYDSLISRAKQRAPEGYVEQHHIVPKCMGGSDDPENVVALTPEEHFLAHVLLVKVYPEERNLIIAVQKMTRGRPGRKSRKLYGWLRRKFAARMREITSGEGNSQYGTRWINDGSVSRKLKASDPIPGGWSFGKVKKKVACVVCGVETETKRSRYCSPCRASRRVEAVNSLNTEEAVVHRVLQLKSWIQTNELEFKEKQLRNIKKRYAAIV